MCTWSCLSLLFIYSSAAVFVTVTGQPTDDDYYDDERLDELMITVARLEAERSTRCSGTSQLYLRI